MPHRCCVPLCHTMGGHRFPRNQLRKTEWLKAICRDNMMPHESSRVCKKHFVPEDYLQENSVGSSPFRSILKKEAVPSLFPWTANSSFENKKEEWRQYKTPQRKKSEETEVLVRSRRHRIIKKKKMSAYEDEEGKRTRRKRTNPVQTKSSKEQARKKTTETEKTELKVKSGDEVAECRACLQRLKVDRLFGLHQGWAPTWESLGTTIAEDLTNLANIQLSETDLHSKFICYTCCEKLWNACHFKMLVQENDRVLRRRFLDDEEKEWPKPIQVDKSLNSSVYDTSLPFNVDIKQEVLSDDEATNMEEGYTETTETHVMEIKVEPEEIFEQSQIIVNGVTSLKEFPNGEIAKQLLNGDTNFKEQQHLVAVKEEPVSDIEDVELSLDCLLCMRPFHSMTGLKAHVIAHHSYQTVGRGAGSNGEKHVCATCRRTFTTSTDLMVHETCHSKHACYGCAGKFDTFAALSAHRRRCPRPAHGPKRHKTLDDVIRPQVENNIKEPKREISDVTNTIANDESKSFSCLQCNEIFSDTYYLKIHQEIHHSKETETKVEPESAPMEIEILESIFNEET